MRKPWTTSHPNGLCLLCGSECQSCENQRPLGEHLPRQVDSEHLPCASLSRLRKSSRTCDLGDEHGETETCENAWWIRENLFQEGLSQNDDLPRYVVRPSLNAQNLLLTMTVLFPILFLTMTALFL